MSNKIGKTDAKYVPFTAIEWRNVQTLFRSNEVEDLQRVCHILDMWKCRMGNKTPVFIDISQLILQSIMLDRDAENELNNFANSERLRAVHGFAIIRFINYVNDICQPEGSKLVSIASAVSSIGIPGWIVNARHDATHCHVPPLSLMQNSLLYCRDWLWKHQWIQEFDDAIRDLPRERFEEEREQRHKMVCRRTTEVLHGFSRWRKEDPITGELVIEQRENAPFNQINNLLTAHADEFIQIFVQTRLSTRVKRLHNSKNSSLRYVSEAEQHYYYPIMQLLNDKNLMPALLLELSKNVADSSIDENARQMLGAWVNFLLEAFLQAGPKRMGTISDQSWKLIIKHVIVASNFFEKEQIQRVLLFMRHKISRKAYMRITKLLTIADRLHNKSSDDNEADDGDGEATNESIWAIKNVNDLRDVNISFSTAKEPLPGNERWTLANIEDLGPLGLTSDQTAETLCLEY